VLRYGSIMKKKTQTKRTTKLSPRKTTRRAKKTVMQEMASDFPATIPVAPPLYDIPEQTKRAKGPSIRLISLGILIIALVLLFATNRGFFLAAVVNGQPIFRWNLNTVLTKRYGQQTLEGMITEKLISAEAQKQTIVVTQQDIEAREKEILSSFGSSMSVDDFLKMQGINKADFENQLKLQIEVQRILTKGLSITDLDLDTYIASNRATLVATDPAKLKDEARQAIIDAKVGEKIDAFLQDLRTKASINSFL
jgi:hypothetical protein